jgi:hypothetical protein
MTGRTLRISVNEELKDSVTKQAKRSTKLRRKVQEFEWKNAAKENSSRSKTEERERRRDTDRVTNNLGATLFVAETCNVS